MDMEMGDVYGVPGEKKIGRDRHWAGSGKVLIEAAAVAESLKTINARTLDTRRCEVTNSIRETDVERLSRLANAEGKGWPTDAKQQAPYSVRGNVVSSGE